MPLYIEQTLHIGTSRTLPPASALGGVDEALDRQRGDELLDVLLALHRVVLRPAVPQGGTVSASRKQHRTRTLSKYEREP